jgi:hypothetical protein
MGSFTNPIVQAITTATGRLSSIVNAGAALINSGPAGSTNSMGNPGQENWYIQAKRKVNRLDVLSDPEVSKLYTKSLEQGRLLENSIGDSMTWIQDKKLQLEARILHLMHMNTLGTDGQLPTALRKPKYIVDCVNFMKEVQKVMGEISALVAALQKDLATLVMIEKNVLGMIQASLNMLSSLLANICNWGLPKLPSIPFIVGDTIWRFNGFGNALNQLMAKPNLSFNFSFSQCNLFPQNLDIFSNIPTSIATAIPSSAIGATPVYIPPLTGVVLLPTVSVSDPNIQAILATAKDTPIFNSTFDPFNQMLGSVPDPVTIVSNYLMPPDVYQKNIVSIAPALRTLVLPVGATPTPANINALKAALRLNVNLDSLVDSNFDPYLTSAWLYELNLNRQLITQGRGGQWIANYQAVYDQYIQPSVDVLTSTPIPWNNMNDLGINDLPTIPLIPILKADSTRNLAWKLSYVEAAILGYPRTTTFEQGQDSTYVSSYTGSDLDYKSTPVDMTVVSTYTLGVGTADYPVLISYPTSMNNALMEVVSTAATSIANSPSWQSSHPQFRYIYNQFAQAALIDRYSQFWREFRSNLSAFLTQNIGLIQEIVSYPAALDSAIDPLGSSTIYNIIEADFLSKNQNWVPGSILLSIPNELFLSQVNNATYIALQVNGPLTNIITPGSNNSVWAVSTSGTGGNYSATIDYPVGSIVSFVNSASTGWSGGLFDAAVFLARPDIQSQSIPVQQAMLSTNQSYASLMSFQNNFQSAVSAAVTAANTMISTVQNSGAHVLTTIGELVPASAGLGGVPVVFQTVDYDNGGFLENPNTIIVNQGGSYLVSGDLEWGATSVVANLGYTLMLNGSTVLGTETLSSDSPDAQTEVFSLTYNFNTGDTLQLFAFSSEDVEIQPGTDLTISVVPGGGAANDLPVSGGGSSTTDLAARTLIADAVLVTGQCVQIDSSGRVTPVLPTIVAYPLSTTQFNIPYVDGVTLAAAGIGDSVQVATAYGSVYEIPGITLTPGGIIYVAANGVLTQDYSSVLANCAWTVCVGKAVAVDSILFQPHLPYPRWDEGTFTDPLPE